MISFSGKDSDHLCFAIKKNKIKCIAQIHKDMTYNFPGETDIKLIEDKLYFSGTDQCNFTLSAVEIYGIETE